MKTTTASNIWLLINKSNYTETGAQEIEDVADFFIKLKADIGPERFNKLYAHIDEYDAESMRIMSALREDP